MPFPIVELEAAEFPARLREIPQPPQQLSFRGALPPFDLKLLTIVGSRKYSTYGKDVVEHIVSGLTGYPVGIVSGLALGIDSLAHEAALRHNLYTLGIPGGGLDDSVLYPARHRPLAYRILEAGGGLLSEFDRTFHVTKWSFVQRNRIVAGISHATLLIEADEKSGTLITARLATDYNRDLMVVPGNIFSRNSAGVHQFLKLGAMPVTTAEDVLEVLGIEIAETPGAPAARRAVSHEEEAILDLLSEPRDRDTLIREIGRPTAEVSILLIQMEMKGLIAESNGQYRVTI